MNNIICHYYYYSVSVTNLMNFTNLHHRIHLMLQNQETNHHVLKLLSVSQRLDDLQRNNSANNNGNLCYVVFDCRSLFVAATSCFRPQRLMGNVVPYNEFAKSLDLAPPCGQILELQPCLFLMSKNDLKRT